MKCLLALLPLLLAAPAAAASTLPRVDVGAGQTTLAVGALDFNLDRAIGDHASLGVSYAYVGAHVAAVRGVYRLAGEPDGFCWGLALSAGFAPYPYWTETVDTSLGDVSNLAELFFQPAVVWSVPFWNFRFRASLGPNFNARIRAQQSYRYMENEVFPIVPNLELAYVFGRGEVTLGGNALAGARLFF